MSPSTRTADKPPNAKKLKLSKRFKARWRTAQTNKNRKDRVLERMTIQRDTTISFNEWRDTEHAKAKERRRWLHREVEMKRITHSTQCQLIKVFNCKFGNNLKQLIADLDDEAKLAVGALENLEGEKLDVRLAQRRAPLEAVGYALLENGEWTKAGKNHEFCWRKRTSVPRNGGEDGANVEKGADGVELDFEGEVLQAEPMSEGEEEEEEDLVT